MVMLLLIAVADAVVSGSVPELERQSAMLGYALGKFLPPSRLDVVLVQRQVM